MSAVVYAVANQKGGVAKTTTSASIASALTGRGLNVLTVDMDPQACLTFSLGFDPDELSPTLHEVITGRSALADTVLHHDETDVAPANLDLAGAEVALLSRTGREYVLKRALAEVRDDYDAIVLDCPPSLGVLTLNGLTAADKVVVPVQCETLSHRGVSQLLETIADVQALTNPDLEVAGLVATMYDTRTRHSREVLEDVQSRYSMKVLGVPVRKSIRFAEAPNEGKTILVHAPRVPGAAAYRVVAAELHGLVVHPEDLAAAGGVS